jgi:hypothetical protein
VVMLLHPLLLVVVFIYFTIHFPEGGAILFGCIPLRRGQAIYPSVLIRGARCCDSCWCRSSCISGGTPIASISCNRASETGRLEDWQVSALIRWCAGAVTAVTVDPFPIQWRGGVPATSISCNPTSETGIYTAKCILVLFL